jgi:flagellar protein FlgJ
MPITSIRDSLPNLNRNGQESKQIDEEKLKKACMDFEAIFTYQMIKSMRQTVPKTGLFDESPGKDIFESLFDQELSRSLAQGGKLGLGKMIYKRMMRRSTTP